MSRAIKDAAHSLNRANNPLRCIELDHKLGVAVFPWFSTSMIGITLSVRVFGAVTAAMAVLYSLRLRLGCQTDLRDVQATKKVEHVHHVLILGLCISA